MSDHGSDIHVPSGKPQKTSSSRRRHATTAGGVDPDAVESIASLLATLRRAVSDCQEEVKEVNAQIHAIEARMDKDLASQKVDIESLKRGILPSARAMATNMTVVRLGDGNQLVLRLPMACGAYNEDDDDEAADDQLNRDSEASTSRPRGAAKEEHKVASHGVTEALFELYQHRDEDGQTLILNTKDKINEDASGWLVAPGSKKTAGSDGVYGGVYVAYTPPFLTGPQLLYELLVREGVPFFSPIGSHAPPSELANIQNKCSSVIVTLVQSPAQQDLGMGAVAEILRLLARGHSGVYVGTNQRLDAAFFPREDKALNVGVPTALDEIALHRQRVHEAYALLTAALKVYETLLEKRTSTTSKRLYSSFVTDDKNPDECISSVVVNYNTSLTAFDGKIDNKGIMRLYKTVHDVETTTDVGCLLKGLFLGTAAISAGIENMNLLCSGGADEARSVKASAQMLHYYRVLALRALETNSIISLRGETVAPPYLQSIFRVMCYDTE